MTPSVRRPADWRPLLLAAAGLAAYANSFWGPFIFDDVSNILLNPAVQELWPSLDEILRPMRDKMALRPLIDRTFALNYALGGFDVRGYHAVNLLIHLAAGLVLYGLVWRTVGRIRMAHGPWPMAQQGIAFAIALFWVVHPLQTQSVTYIVQRAESLMGLWYLLTLYSLCRAATEPGTPAASPRGFPSQSEAAGRAGVGDGSPEAIGRGTRSPRWTFLAILSCALGMATKTVMVTAPLMAWLYDWMFLSGSWRALWRQRAALHAGLAATWLIPVGLIAAAPRDAELTIGYGLSEVTALQYLATQPGVILHYLRLAFWPHPLVLDYNWPIAGTFTAVAPPALVIVALLGLTGWALARRHPLGFAGAWFFLTLAPTSSVFPLVDLAFEHRMYLALAAPIAAVVLIGWGLLWRATGSDERRVRIGTALVAGAAMTLCVLTIRRNADYRSDIGMWQDVLRKRPDNPRPHDNLSYIYARQGRLGEAEAAVREAIRLKPESPEYQVNLGNVLQQQGRFDEAVASYTSALRRNRQDAVPYSNLGNLFARQRRPEEAIAMYGKAIELMPYVPELHHNVALLLAGQGRFQEAVRHFSEVLRLQPKSADARRTLSTAENNWGAALFNQGELGAAIERFMQALQVDPANESARSNLSKALAVRRGAAKPSVRR